MEERQIYLSNGDLLIRSSDGVYFRQDVGISVPLVIDREEGEYLLFETCNQLKMVTETLAPMVKRYEVALEKIAEETGTPYAKIATKALMG